MPLLHREANAASIVKDVKQLVRTERWNSFDRFHQTTQTLLRAYKRHGAGTEVYQAQTGGELGNGHWIIHEAADVHSATLDIVAPVQMRVLDYQQNPWHVVQWSAATPREGIRCELVALDALESLRAASANDLRGKIVLTALNLRDNVRELFEKGAVGVISDAPPGHGTPPGKEAVAWTKFGWGGLSVQDSHARLVGFAISPEQGKKLRALLSVHGKLTLLARADLRHYVGTHDVVSARVLGKDDPQSEVWAVAHSSEPGALDNASGVAACIEIAGLLERLIASGKLPRPRRSIRFLHGYECYGFFHYLEHQKRFQTPLAGVCIDTVGAQPALCGEKLRWHSTVPASAGFVDDVGETMLRAALRIDSAGYQFEARPFQSTEDTLLGDPKYGFPCPWITNHPFKGYHSSADIPALLHPRGLKTTAAAMAGYLYYLANAASTEALEMAEWQTGKIGERLAAAKTPAHTEFIGQRHEINLTRLKRWLWGGQHREILAKFSAFEIAKTRKGGRLTQSVVVPHRVRPLAPTLENMKTEVACRLERGVPKWALYWADGERSTAGIARLLSVELNRTVSDDDVENYFIALEEIGYVRIQKAETQKVSFLQLVNDLKTLGVKPGMDLMVHSSLSKIGSVTGGAPAVIDALVSVIGKNGTLLMPSFNHFEAHVFNPLATPTTNGAIPDAMWRRPDAVRSRHASHAIAAIGPKAEAWCRGHLENGIWAQSSPIGRLISDEGYILLLGVTHEASTAYHVAEISMNCGCLDQFGSWDRIVTEKGQVETVRGLAWRAEACPIHPRKIGETLDRLKLQVHGKVGDAAATLVKSADVWSVRRQHLKNVCVGCEIKPVRRGSAPDLRPG